MSLKIFHIVFIALSSLLSLLLVYWGLQEYQTSGSHLGLSLLIVGCITLALLIPYFGWFQKKMRHLSLALLILLGDHLFLHSNTLWACSVCFGDPTSPLIKSVKVGIVFLVATVAGVLGAISAVAYSWSRKAKELERLRSIS